MAKLLFFGKLRDLAGASQMELPDLESRTVAALCMHLKQQSPDLANAISAPGIRIAVDQVFAGGDTTFGPHSEIAFMPPMSGG